MYNIAQSFYVDSAAVQGSPSAFITSVDLFFKQKPTEGQATSGINKPGVTVNICSVVNGKPTFDLVDSRTYSRVEFDNILTSIDATTSTKFTFSKPFILSSDKEYAIVIAFDGIGGDFVLWKNSSNEEDIVTGLPSKVSSGKVDGNYFDLTNGSDFSRRDDVDLKFKVNVAKFTGARSNTFVFCNDAYEFISLRQGTVNGQFVGGEYVYRAQANLVGTVAISSGSSNVTGTGTDFVTNLANGDLVVFSNATASQVKVVNIITNTTFMNVTTSFATSVAAANLYSYESGLLAIDNTSNTIIGTGTDFTAVPVGSFIAITDGTDANTEIRKVISVDIPNDIVVLDVKPSFSNNQGAWFITPTAKVEKFRGFADNLVLSFSAANSTYYFTSNTIIKGVDFQANGVIDSVNNVELSAYRPTYSIATPAGTSAKYYVNFANSSYATSVNNLVEVKNKAAALVGNYPAQISSRSNEVQNPTNLFANSKSMNTTVEFSSENPFVSPFVTENNLDFITSEFLINNDSTNEAYSNGAAYARYVSKIVTLEDDQIAEDMILFLTAFKPSGTNIEVYIKMLSEEDDEFITDKNWTELELNIPSGGSVNSIDANQNDFIELKYTIPPYNLGTTVSSGTFNVATSTNVITASFSTVNTSISVGDVVRVYNPTFPDTYFTEIVTAANTTSFTVSEAVSNNDLAGAGLLVDVITEKNSAFLNNQNFNIVRYFNKSGAKYDGYKSFAVKIVLLAENYYLVPRVTEYRAIAVSA
jgi:hypothetical protein